MRRVKYLIGGLAFLTASFVNGQMAALCRLEQNWPLYCFFFVTCLAPATLAGIAFWRVVEPQEPKGIS